MRTAARRQERRRRFGWRALHGGALCRSVAVTGTEFCQHHGAVADEHCAKAVKRGEHLPVRRARVVQEPVIAEPMAVIGNGAGTADPVSIGPRLAAAAAESVEELRRVLLKTATGANKQLWATVVCEHCDRAGRYEITVPDNNVRLDAVQALLHEALGRPAQAEAPWRRRSAVSASRVRARVRPRRDVGRTRRRRRPSAPAPSYPCSTRPQSLC